jgi:hypothetical protein
MQRYNFNFEPKPMSELSAASSFDQTPSPKSLLEVTLSGAIALARSGKNYDQAAEQFAAIVAHLEKDAPEATVLLKQLWSEYISVQRSALFYEGLSSAEAGLSEKMAESNIQLQQNYMRLIQEQ